MRSVLRLPSHSGCRYGEYVASWRRKALHSHLAGIRSDLVVQARRIHRTCERASSLP